MITKSVFLKTVKNLEEIFEHELTERQIELYYETMSPDFTDAQFLKQANAALKNSFKFPPIAAFYKDAPETMADYPSPDMIEVYKRIREKNGLD